MLRYHYNYPITNETQKRGLTMRQEEAFEFLCRLAQGIASMFGDSCETVVHEMEGERMKNLVIFNGHVSGRSAGDL